jgi:hypothetical protein
VLCSNPVQTMTDADAVALDVGVRASARVSNLNQLNFRILSTSPGAMLNAKLVLIFISPLCFTHWCSGSKY